MAEDIRIRLGFFGHPKTDELEEDLGPGGPWCFVRLWKFCAETPGRQKGDLGGLTDAAIERAAKWPKDNRGQLVAALVRVGYLDGDEGHRRIHDFEEHQPHVAQGEERSASARESVMVRWHKEGKHNEIKGIGCPECDRNTDGIRPVNAANTPPSLPSIPPKRESADPSLLQRHDQIAQVAIVGLGLKRPGGGYERRMAALVPLPRAVVEHAVAQTLDGADVPNWGYFLQCLEKPRANRSRAGPNERDKRISTFDPQAAIAEMEASFVPGAAQKT